MKDDQIESLTASTTSAPHEIKCAADSDRESWDGYVQKHPDASLFHLFGWRDVIHETYAHPAYYLMAVQGEVMAPVPGGDEDPPARTVVGVLPLVHLKHRIFGNSLVSLPFFDGGGILADSREVEATLLSGAVRLSRKLGASKIELRQEGILASCHDISACGSQGSQAPLKLTTRSDKVRMLMNVPESSEMLMKSFKSKLRSQIAKPLKEGLTSKVGGAELLEDFYRVFLVNMRDLGSPVHSIRLMQRVLTEFSDRSRIFVVYKADEPVASALVIGLGKMLRNPWASSLRKYAILSPNMLLYLRMLEFACDNGYRVFDFGRSTRGEGTYKFKEQWGSVPTPLYWHYVSLDGKSIELESSGMERFKRAAHYWRKLPVSVTRLIGPSIRKHISL
jgi:FemAB-related protein (PEP-CTERM system-associated)